MFSGHVEQGTRCDDQHTPLCIRTIQGHCALPMVSPLYLHLMRVRVGFTKEKCHVRSASNNYSIEMDGLLAGGRCPQIGRQATHFSAVRPLSRKIIWPDEGSTRLQIVPYQQRKQHLDAINIFAAVETDFLATKKLCIVHFGNLPPELLLRTDTLNGQLALATTSASNVRTKSDILDPACTM